MRGAFGVVGPASVLAVLGGSSALALVALVLPGLFPASSGDWVLAALTGVVPVALMALGARSSRSRSRLLGGVLLALAATLAGAALLVLALTGRSPSTAVAGLPPAAVVQIVGFWLLPLPLATLGYALTFDRSSLDREALAALRRRAGTDAADRR